MSSEAIIAQPTPAIPHATPDQGLTERVDLYRVDASRKLARFTLAAGAVLKRQDPFADALRTAVGYTDAAVCCDPSSHGFG